MADRISLSRDWYHRDVQLLDEYGYPPVERDEVYVEIFEQAENFRKNKG